MAIGQRQVAGVAVAVLVQRDGAAEHLGGAGRRLLVDVPRDLLKPVEVERVQIEHAHLRLVASVTHGRGGRVDLDIAVVPRSHHERGGRSGRDQTEQSGECGEEEKQMTPKAG